MTLRDLEAPVVTATVTDDNFAMMLDPRLVNQVRQGLIETICLV